MPSATFVILLPPLFKPSFVRLTASPPARLMVMPSPLITVLLPPFVKVADVKPFNSFAKRNFNVSEPSETTPMLSSVANLLSSEIPPLTFTWLLSFFLITFPVSPPYIIPSSRVASVCVLPSLSSVTKRLMLVPSTPFLASPPLIVTPS